MRGEICFHRDEHSEDRQQQQRDLDEPGQRVHHQHAFQESRVLRQREHPGDCDRAPSARDHRADEQSEAQFQTTQREEISRQHGQHRQNDNGFGRRELEQLKVADAVHWIPPFDTQSNSGELKLCEIRSSSSLG